MISTEEKQQKCQACPLRRNYFCTRHGDEWRRIIQERATCEGWGNVPPPVSIPAEAKLGDSIRLGFMMPNLAMGGVTRLILTMMEAQAEHGLEWAGVAIGAAQVFDIETARLIRRHCPIYCTTDAPEFQGLVEVVPNACQAVFERSDVVNLWGYVESNAEIDAVAWDSKPMLVVSHGQCEWTRKNLAVSLSHAGKSIPVAVSEAAGKCFLDATQEPHTVIYNGLDFSRCAPARDRDTIRREWGVKPGQKAIGYIGRLAYDKNPLATARAVAALGEDYHAVYVGEGWQSGEITREVKQICGERATFAPRTNDIGSALAALDCIITAAPNEGGPLVAAEAWLAGCPVVSTSAGMIPELERDHGPLVWRIPREATPNQLAAATRDALEGDERTARARRLAWNLFSPGRLVRNYEDTIRAALRPDPEPAPEPPRPGFFTRLIWKFLCW